MGRNGEICMKLISRLSLTLDDILQVEDEAGLLDFKCSQTGILLWPMVRTPFFRAIMSDMLYGTPMSGAAPAVPKLKAIATLGKAVIHNAIHGRHAKADIVLMATGMGGLIKDGVWFNRLCDHFAMANRDQTLVIEDFFNWQWPTPRHNDRMLFHAPIQAVAAALGRIACLEAHRSLSRRLIALVSQRAKQILGWDMGPERTAILVDLLARRYAAMPWLYRSYLSMLEQIAPKILIKEEACYGPSAVLMWAAKDLGIATAEYQHGAISSGHDAYNLAPLLRNSSEYKKTLPDYFLGYGKWWNDQINVPVRKIAIGNPHRAEQIKRYADCSEQRRTDILVLGDGIETDLYVNLALELAERIKSEFSVVFRPHPLERAVVYAKYLNGTAGAVRIDKNDDIYKSFTTAHVVISELSTGLFEAVGLANKIFIWNTAKARFSFPNHPFRVFDDAGDLVRKLLQDDKNELTPEQNRGIWEPDWRATYQSFLADLGLKYEG